MCINITVFLYVALCGLVDRYWCFEEPCCLHLQGAFEDTAEGAFNTTVPTYLTV